jgi:hypothetical protein
MYFNNLEVKNSHRGYCDANDCNNSTTGEINICFWIPVFTGMTKEVLNAKLLKIYNFHISLFHGVMLNYLKLES